MDLCSPLCEQTLWESSKQRTSWEEHVLLLQAVFDFQPNILMARCSSSTPNALFQIEALV